MRVETQTLTLPLSLSENVERIEPTPADAKKVPQSAVRRTEFFYCSNRQGLPYQTYKKSEVGCAYGPDGLMGSCTCSRENNECELCSIFTSLVKG